MKNIYKIISVISVFSLPVVSQGSSAERGTAHAANNPAEAMYGGGQFMTFDSSMDTLSTLPESTIEYLLERQNRNQVDEILSLIDDVEAAE